MPFLQEDGSVETNPPAGRIGSALPLAQLVVDPQQVLTLKHGIEAECARVDTWLTDNRYRLQRVQRPGTDPCSEEIAQALAENGQAAVDAASGYVTQLGNVAQALGDIAKAYGLTEEESSRRFPREHH